MTKKRARQWAFLLVALAGLLAAAPAFAQVEKATVKINGMIWGLWAKGAEKALERLDGVRHADVNLVKGEGTVFPKAGKSFDPALIPKAIHGAGFTATEVAVVADGTLATRNGALELDVPGLAHPFLLTGGSKINALKKRADLLGKRIRVTGKLGPAQAKRPPSLAVEDFRGLPWGGRWRGEGQGLAGGRLLARPPSGEPGNQWGWRGP
jgi:copper chaperone CopZ